MDSAHNKQYFLGAGFQSEVDVDKGEESSLYVKQDIKERNTHAIINNREESKNGE